MVRERLTDSRNVTKFYQDLTNRGLQYANLFQSIKDIQYNDAEVLGEIHFDVKGPFYLHPAFLDSCFQLVQTFTKGSTDVYALVSILNYLTFYWRLCQS
jgi:hypothetical protein